MGLTTHILDTAQGCPVAHLTIELWAIDRQSAVKTLLKTVTTNADGRTDAPLLDDTELAIGRYELVFWVGEYFTRTDSASPTAPNPPFLDRIPVQFGIADATARYHIPLLVSPWSYSTYRGS